MRIIWKISPTKSQTPTISCLVFRPSVLHYRPIAAKPTSAVPNDSPVRGVQFEGIAWDENRNTLEKVLLFPRTQLFITDWSPDRHIANLCGATYGLKAWIANKKSCSIYSAGIFVLIFFKILYHFETDLKTKMEKVKQKLILFVSSFSHANTQNWIWQKCLSIMIVPCNCCLSLELSVWSVLAHTFWTLAEFTEFFLSLSLKQTQKIPRRLLPAFVTIVGKLIVSKRHPLFSRSHSMSV